MTALLEVAEKLDPRDPRSRLAAVADEGSLRIEATVEEVVTAKATVAGVPVALFATDPRVKGGALSWRGGETVASCIDGAVEDGTPVIGVWQSGGARLADGALSLDGMGRLFAATVRASGRIAHISLVLGPAAGGAAYGPALTDLIVLGPGARVFVTGPDIVREVTGEDVDAESLGGPAAHEKRSGLAAVSAETDGEAYDAVRDLIALLGRPTSAPAPRRVEDPSALLPDRPRRAYDVRPLLSALLDSPPRELQARHAPNVVTALGRLAGRTVGVIANNPIRLGGCLDAPSAEKAARFVRLCDSQGIPLVVVVDVPGFLPGVRQEHEGVVRRGAKLLHAFADAQVPRVTLITRKAFGGAYIAMNSRALGATAVYAWPTAEVGVMGAEPAVRLLHRKHLATVPPAQRPEEEARLTEAFREESGGVDAAVRAGLVDRVIDPRETREVLATALAAVPARRASIRNIPL